MRITPPGRTPPPTGGDFHHDDEVQFPPHTALPPDFTNGEDGKTQLKPEEQWAAFAGIRHAVIRTS